MSPSIKNPGSRTQGRMGQELFAEASNFHVATSSLCKAVCRVYCKEREELLFELLKKLPAHTQFGSHPTDFKTISDIVAGGNCFKHCDCDNAETVLQTIKERWKKEGYTEKGNDNNSRFNIQE